MDRHEWTLDEEAADLGREVAILQADGIWVGDGVAASFLAHLSPVDQRTFIALLAAGRLRMAIGLVADGAMRCGIRDAPAMFASNRVKIMPGPPGMEPVEYQPQRIPPHVGVIFSYALGAGIQRAELARVLRKGGRIQQWGMRNPVIIPPLSKRDTDEILKLWPMRSRAGNPGRARQREQ